MASSETYTQYLKPTEKELLEVQAGYEELEKLLKSSRYHEGGFYILNGNKVFSINEYQDIRQHKILLEADKHIELGAIEVSLSKECYRDIGKKSKPDKVYGRKQILESSYRGEFNRGHLIAESLIKYCTDFDYYKRENFVMITNWCNRATTCNHKHIACGMLFFEQILLDSLEDGVDICYRVTPVFKKLDASDDEEAEQSFEYLPRGIIMEAIVTNGKAFTGQNVERLGKKFEKSFNVFIPNAQRDLVIDYRTGEIGLNDNSVTLKDLYEAKGFKMKDLGEVVGVSHRTIRRWNKDIAYIPFKNVVNLAKGLDMSVDELAELLLLDY